MGVWLFVVLVLLVGSYLLTRKTKARPRSTSDAEKSLNEADFLIAYGKKNEAISLLEEASLKHRNNQAIRNKLEELRRRAS
jgi:Tfp pilus assembly protein FimV